MQTCQKCGAPLPSAGWEGLCPKCLVRVSIGAGAEGAAPIQHSPAPSGTEGGQGIQSSPKAETHMCGTPIQSAVPPQPDVLLERTGMMIGRYKLLQKIGEGGCGIVYMAEQEQPVRRKVALKVIKLGMDTRSVVARFEAERQALALMDHPNIAKVLDAGPTENGRPYFVMELVRGHKITQYCDEQRFSTRQRLDLFIQVCQAVQHAHQKGIIHRDLKPSNILVTERDGVPVTKVIDFGIAKATCDLQLTDKTLFTAFEQFIGTPAYMSPEQARLGELDIDTRSDIYSLGVLLYELLTGQPPFDAADLRRLAMDEVLKTIRETDPPLPSSRFTTMTEEQRTNVAHSRQVEPALLPKLVRGDLDWIVMKCLEKDRTRRYETANGLLVDIQHHFQNEPVVARSPNTFYRFRKMVKRNKLEFAAVSAVAASLIIGLGFSLWQFTEKSRAYSRTVIAESKERRAREEAQKAQANEAQQRQEAQAIGRRLAQALDQLQLQNAEELFTADNAVAAVAHLSRLLRQNPTNEVAGQRLFSALTYRNFTFPVTEALKEESDVDWADFSSDGQTAVTVEGRIARVYDLNTGRPLTGPIKHEANLNSASFSPDGQQVVTACGRDNRQGYAQVWDAATGRPLTEPLRYSNSVWSASFSPDGQNVVTRSSNSFRIWNAKSGQLLQSVKCNEQLTHVQFSPDGRRVVTADDKMTVRVWDTQTGQPIGQAMKLNTPVTSVEFSPDGQRILTGCSPRSFYYFSSDKTPPPPPSSGARIWDSNTGLPLTPLLKHSGGVHSARFSPDGLRVVTASPDKSARVWDAQTGEPLTEPLRHTAGVLWAEFSSDGLRIVTASGDKTARVWEAKTGKPLTESLKHRETVTRAHFSPNGNHVVTASADHTVRTWDTRPRPVLTQTFTQRSPIWFGQFSPDGKQVLTSGYYDDKKVFLWDAQSGRLLAELPHDGLPLNRVSFSPDGLRVVTIVSAPEGPRSARVWDAKTVQLLTPPLKNTNDVDVVAISLDGLRIITVSRDHTVRVWDSQTGLPLTEPLQHTQNVWAARLSPDGLKVLTTSVDQTARLWDLQTGRPLIELKDMAPYWTAEFSPDGRFIVVASSNKTAQVWDVKNGGPIMEFQDQAAGSYAQFSPDSRFLVTATADNAAQVWDVKTGRKVGKTLNHEDMVVSAVFSPDGESLVTKSKDCTVRIWDVGTGESLTGPLLHDVKVTSVRFSPDGLRIVTTSLDKTARVWDARSGQPISEALQDEDGVGSAVFSPDGERLLTVSGGQSAHIWELPKVPLPVPNWVMDLADVVSANRLDEQGVLQPVPFNVLKALKTKVNESTASDAWTRLAKWLFADPANRAISPFAPEALEK